ncbi:hypothetical protein SAMN06265365_11336 [Tistlia consotensis]|uniref:Uncharacterized protein n=1 Tax=Tistlia consotensis USBA 355 TaxID=560819 RepID=A0A1Y6C890_9PROT|nr:hypothetical protein [Tistlia consotensis]SMF41606.1 hypothetical protein SAMN05428998_114109 [Tistlia consotensis USBA 355]SNR73580.1 hypothetical protein SAMN06265365_11336 [Tistlia consotensis]
MTATRRRTALPRLVRLAALIGALVLLAVGAEAGWREDAAAGYRIWFPDSWTVQRLEQPPGHTVIGLSPDEAVAVSITAVPAGRPVTADQMMQAFESTVLSDMLTGGRAVDRVRHSINGLEGNYVTYVGSYDEGQGTFDAVVHAFYAAAGETGYFLWWIIPSAQAAQRRTEADRIFQSLTVASVTARAPATKAGPGPAPATPPAGGSASSGASSATASPPAAPAGKTASGRAARDLASGPLEAFLPAPEELPPYAKRPDLRWRVQVPAHPVPNVPAGIRRVEIVYELVGDPGPALGVTLTSGTPEALARLRKMDRIMADPKLALGEMRTGSLGLGEWDNLTLPASDDLQPGSNATIVFHKGEAIVRIVARPVALAEPVARLMADRLP